MLLHENVKLAWVVSWLLPLSYILSNPQETSQSCQSPSRSSANKDFTSCKFMFLVSSSSSCHGSSSSWIPIKSAIGWLLEWLWFWPWFFCWVTWMAPYQRYLTSKRLIGTWSALFFSSRCLLWKLSLFIGIGCIFHNSIIRRWALFIILRFLYIPCFPPLGNYYYYYY